MTGHVRFAGLAPEWKIVAVCTERGEKLPGEVKRQGDACIVEIPGALRGQRVSVRLAIEHASGARTVHDTAPLFVTRVLRTLIPAEGAVRCTLGGFELRLCRVPAGSYRIGIPKSRLSRLDRMRQYLIQSQDRLASFPTEDGTLGVDLALGFLIAEHEVTRAQWRQLVPGAPAGADREELPVDNVTYDQARKWCRSLTEALHRDGVAGFALRLPTEIEWEIAARAQGAGPFPGKAKLADVAHEQLLPPGKAAGDRSEFGILDLGGNLCEWTCTRYRETLPALLLELARSKPEWSSRLPVDPRVPGILEDGRLVVPETAGRERVSVRGAAYVHHSNHAVFDVSWRRGAERDRASNMTGFRYVIVPQ